MVNYNMYPPLLPEAPLPPLMRPSGSENPQIPYHLSMVQAKRRGVIAKEKMFKKKYKKYTKILNRLMWLNACSSGISIATGISSVTTFATFIGIPVSTALGAASMTTGVIASGMISVLTKKYQQKRKKVTELIDIVPPALVVFERVVSGTLKNGVID